MSFIESFATILIERGFYFYTRDMLGFNELGNLSLGLIFGVFYVCGALYSHRISIKFTEKHTLQYSLFSLLSVSILFPFITNRFGVSSLYALAGIFTGTKWPIIESYINAGLPPKHTFRAVGRFSLAWASAAPLALGVSGLLINTNSPIYFFWLAAGINATSLILSRNLIRKPIHLPQTHPEFVQQDQLKRYSKLLRASHLSMLSSYTLLFLLAPLLPTIFASIGFDIQYSAALSGVLDGMRVLAFLILGIWPAWQGRSLPVFTMIFALPIGFLMILFGPNFTVILIGEILFGLAAGLMYYGSLYYAMVVKNASVDAGGTHEGLIGTGFAIGPLIGILGISLSSYTGYITGMLICVSPVIIFCIISALKPLWHLRKISQHTSNNNRT